MWLPEGGERRRLTISDHGTENPEQKDVSTIERRVLTDTPADTVRGIALAALAYVIWTLGDTAAKFYRLTP